MRVADAGGLGERSFPGRARAGQEVNLSFRVSGPLETLPVDVGDEVKKGKVVASLEPSDYRTALSNVQGQLEREQAKAERAQKDLARLENTFKSDPGAISETAIDRAKEVLASAQATVRSLEAAVKNAQNQLAYTKLEAPFDGTVVETYVENFETVIAKQQILRIVDPTSIEFVISVPENLIGYAPNVEDIEVTFDAIAGMKVPATIKEIGKEASQATRTYPVTLVMEQQAGKEILPGMAGSARVTARRPEESEDAGLEIPATAVFSAEDPEKSYVWVVDEASNKLSRREIQAGQLSRFGTQVQGGIQPGEWIVTKGVHSLAEGDEVKIIDTSEEGPSS